MKDDAGLERPASPTTDDNFEQVRIVILNKQKVTMGQTNWRRHGSVDDIIFSSWDIGKHNIEKQCYFCCEQLNNLMYLLFDLPP